ncbi:MAG: VOC family protein [Euryarchaeota archaeon]|nr:VOC family protein [Euryarchaeota archaeon]MDE2044984.1 VOC family protein [Thermoplasmata archaeon]
MLSGVGSVAVLVRDARKAADWYCEKLGFEVVARERHLVFLRPPGSSLPLIHLCGEGDDWQGDSPGGRTGIWFRCGETRRTEIAPGVFLPASTPRDVEHAYRELKARGVELVQELTDTGWGKMAVFRDPDGNEFEIS